MLTGLFWDTVDSFAGLFDGFYYLFTGESTSKADKFNNLGSMKIPNTPLTQKRSVIRTARSVLGILCFSRGLECMMACGCIRRFCSLFQICIKMSFLNYHDWPWRATADLVCGRVSSRVPAWLLALSRYASIIGCLLLCFTWTSASARKDFPVSGGLVEDDHHARTLEDGVFCHLVAVSVHVTFVYRRRHTFYPCAPLHICHVWWSALLTGPDSARAAFPHMLEIICD